MMAMISLIITHYVLRITHPQLRHCPRGIIQQPAVVLGRAEIGQGIG